jgi:hypothetical protein
MGYYYEFRTKKIKLRKDTPKEVLKFLSGMIYGSEDEITKPSDHKFFSLDRWDRIFNSLNDDLKPSLWIPENGNPELIISCDINYGYEEIKEFAKWITPYVSGHKPKEYIGEVIPEESWRRFNLYIER